MKSFIVIALLAVSLTAITAAPRTQGKIQIKSIAPNLSDEEFNKLLDDTFNAVVGITEGLKSDLGVLFEGTPVQQDIKGISEKFFHDFYKVFEDVITYIIWHPTYDFDYLMDYVFNTTVPLVKSVVADVRTAVENESAELREATEALLVKFTEDLTEAVRPLVEAIGDRGRLSK